MMGIASSHFPNVQAHRTVSDKCEEEFFNKFGIKAADLLGGDLKIIAKAASAANVGC